jgi:hypothetical protein
MVGWPLEGLSIAKNTAARASRSLYTDHERLATANGRTHMDKVTQVLLDALKDALAQPGEQRLYRSGKFPGIFPGRTGLNAEAAAQALRDGLIEVRSETKGKTVTEFARLTNKAVDFIHEHESPARAMDELRAVLKMTEEGVPVWVAEIRQQINALGQRLTDEVQSVMRRLDVLNQRVLEGLRRHDANQPTIPEDAAAQVPWAQEVVAYLERRRATGVINHCSLPELFRAVAEKHPELALPDFHAGLRLLHDRGVIRLLPAEDPKAIQEPEYQLAAGTQVYYYVTR